MPGKDKNRSNELSHVLVVDDDRDLAENIRAYLTGEGFTVSVATDGNQAVAYIETKNPDLIILDIMMPMRSGFLVLERMIKERDVSIPVVVITANEGTRHRKYAEMLGVNDYFLKPFTMERLLGSVTNLLES